MTIPRSPSVFRSVFAFLGRHYRAQPGRIALILVSVCVVTTADLALPVFSGRLVDAVAAGRNQPRAQHDVLVALAVFAGLGVLTAIARFIQFHALIAFTLRMMATIGREAFWRVQRFSTDWHANSFAGSTVRKITRGMGALDLLNDTILIELIPPALVLIGATITLGSLAPALGALVAVGALAFAIMAGTLALRVTAPAARLSNAWDTRLGGALADSISCNAVVKSFGAEDREDARVGWVIGKWTRRTRRTWGRSTNNAIAQMIVLALLRVGVVGMAAWLWWRDAASPGDITMVLTTWFVVQGYLREIGRHIGNLQRSVNDLEELVALHAEPFGIADRPDAGPARIGAGRIVFDDVVFRYGRHATPLFDGLRVTIAAGERVGLVGHSGSGKTTFVKLIQRLHDVTDGGVTIDGRDVRDVTQASLRAGIAVVQQDPILFHRTLAENIAYGRPGAGRRDIEDAARQAHAHEFIATLPRGYGTLVGERGIKLSGGERQRVAIARALLADTPILIFDEATSSLDSESEALIQDAMERLMRGRTSIVIAHRLSTVRALDRILVFEHGRIIEHGPHVALMRRPDGRYRRLFEQQSLGLTAA